MFLVDASVWVVLGEPEDPYHPAARSLVLNDAVPLAALDLTLYEIANAVGVKKGRVDDANYMAQLVLTRCRDRFVRIDGAAIEFALAIATEHGLSAYDAAYVAAARRQGWTLVSTDIRDLVSKGLAVTPDAADYS